MYDCELALPFRQIRELKIERRAVIVPIAGRRLIEIERSVLREHVFSPHQILAANLDLRSGPPDFEDFQAPALFEFAEADFDGDLVPETPGQGSHHLTISLDRSIFLLLSPEIIEF